jgi:CRISPR system Cascade subunit CasD
MDCLLLRLDAPLQSFGGVMVDQINPTERCPGLSLLTGLLANALGYTHAEHQRLAALQGRLRYAARWDHLPRRIMDYHTVDLGQGHLKDTGWTTRGRMEERGGGSAATGTHIRFRYYLANGVMTVVLALAAEAAVAAAGAAEAGGPTLDELAKALERPARPLFIGRKCCLPCAPLLIGRGSGAGLREILATLPLAPPRPGSLPSPDGCVEAWWPEEEGPAAPGDEAVETHDLRDWHHQVHTGQRHMMRGLLRLTVGGEA